MAQIGGGASEFHNKSHNSGIKEFLSFRTAGEKSFIIFNRLGQTDSILLLYERGTDVKNVLTSFIETGLKIGDSCFYAYDPDYEIRAAGQGLFLFPFRKNVLFPNIKELEKQIESVVIKNSGKMKIVVNWGNMRGYSKEEEVLLHSKRMIEKAGKIKVPTWKRKIGKPDFIIKPTLIMNAFEIDSLSTRALEELIEIHNKIIFLTKNENITSLPGISLTNLAEKPTEIFSEDIIESVAKRNIEIIILAMFEKEKLSGYELIKKISSQFHILLSQGTVYPLLYAMERNGILKVEDGRGREKKYEFTEEGKRIANEKINSYRKGYSYLFGILS